jgi:RsmE family RNA methyltransferase
MNRILFEEQAAVLELASGDPRLEHVRGVLRARVGDVIDVGVVNGPVGRGRVCALGRGRIRIEVEWDAIPPPFPPVTLLVGLCRPATMRKILITAPTLGVRRLVIAPAGRSDPAYARSSLWHDGEWRRRLIEGAEQAFETRLPEFFRADSLQEAMEYLPEGGVRLAPDVYEGGASLGELVDPDRSVAIAVGPERGWNQPDRVCLSGNGFQLVSLGSRVMRVETAVTLSVGIALDRMGCLHSAG